ncbi:MAG: endonuclease/exonuclease/phosphatase family protein [Verrucomicrobiota bacterium]
MTFNIHHAEGLDGQIDTQRIADLITNQNVDLVGLQEVDRGTTRTGGRDIIAELAQKTGMSFVFSNNLAFQGGQYGNAILSRFPIKSRDHRLLTKVGTDGEQRGWLKAVVSVNGYDLSFWVTHLDSRSNDAERVLSATNFNNWLTNETGPVIFCGDFNDLPFSRTYNILAQKWSDSWLSAGNGNGYTIPSPSPNRRIDFIWLARGTSLHAVTASVPFSVASDHFPVVLQVGVTNPTPVKRGFYFSLNEGSGSTFVDQSNGLTGTNVSPAQWDSVSPSGNAGDFSLQFNGAQKISAPDPDRLITTNGINGNYTLQAWVKLPLHFAPPARMILFQYEGTPGFSFSINTNRTLHTTTFTVSDIPSGAMLPDDGLWHHVAVVHTDGVEMKFFIDGLAAATVNYVSGMGARNSPVITVGASSITANPLTGSIDRIHFNNEAFTAAQLDFPAQFPTLGIRPSGNFLTIFWPTNYPGYTAQICTNLATTNWQTVSAFVEGNENVALVSATNTASFFRLLK